jgi:hypothetical protein
MAQRRTPYLCQQVELCSQLLDLLLLPPGLLPILWLGIVAKGHGHFIPATWGPAANMVPHSQNETET